jgi:transposase
VPAIQPYIIEPIWEQFAALLPERKTDHPLGCHRRRIPDRVVFEKLVQVLVFGCAYWRIADEQCSASTLRRRRDEWIDHGAMDALEEIVKETYDRTIGLELSDIAVDCCITKAPCGWPAIGQKPGGQGQERHQTLGGRRCRWHPAWSRGGPGQSSRLPTVGRDSEYSGGDLGRTVPDSPRVHLDRGYDSDLTRKRLTERDLGCVIFSEKGKPYPLGTTNRWVVERTNSWQNAHKKLVWCTERRSTVIDFWIAFSNVIIIVGRLVRKAWSRYRWESRPSRRP